MSGVGQVVVTGGRPPRVRCAIYTRKSSEEGLEQEFNSLDAQREAGESYVLSQKHEGWMLVPEHYDDGGYSGGNLDRPALNRLLEDIRAGHIDVVVVYKVDRLSRSLTDFARIVQVFEESKNAVFHRDKGICVFCKTDITKLINQQNGVHYDHVLPLAKGGMNDITNLQLLCENCNLKKAATLACFSYEYQSWYKY